MNRSTISDVARKAGVSESTVSRVLNGTARVAATKQRAVELAIREMGFQPNAFARGLATGRSNAIGVVTQAIDSPFYGEGMHGIERTLQASGYTPIFMSGHWNSDDEERCIRELIQRRVDGLILFAGRLGAVRIAEFAQQLPVVVTGRTLDAPGVFSLSVDDEAGARLATEHLIDLGHRRIAFIAGPRDHPDAQARLKGYRSALDHAGITYLPALVTPGDFREEGGRLAGERLLAMGEPLLRCSVPTTRRRLVCSLRFITADCGCPMTSRWWALTICLLRPIFCLRSPRFGNRSIRWVTCLPRRCS